MFRDVLTRMLPGNLSLDKDITPAGLDDRNYRGA